MSVATPLKTAIHTALTTGTPTLAVYRRGGVPADHPIPYTTWFVVTRMPEENLEGEDEELTHCIVQTDTFSPDEDAADAVRDQLRLRMLAATDFASRTQDIPGDYETDTKLYNSRGQYSVWKST